MIKCILIVNHHGIARLTRFYEYLPVDRQQKLVKTVHALVTKRSDHMCSFVDDQRTFGTDTKVVYRHFATLYFVVLCDRSESELGILDLIQVYVEALDRSFESVCELDIVFNSPKAHAILDEIVMGGEVLETSATEALKNYNELAKLEKANADPSLRVQASRLAASRRP
mmetsp:Transcript_9087/g.31632  ORF Transcript_9087/g.31632 Transcript_9087/m.31632 type:complete len:169 (+) Transcript_9087:650-1156(+)